MSFPRKEKIFLFFAMLSAFAICGEYAITRPASNALFLTFFSYKLFPWVWLATVPINFAVIWLYNRFLPKIGPLKMLLGIACLAMGMNALAGGLYNTFPHFIFLQFVWKDIYVLLMLKQLWSMIHSTVSGPKAKYLYGFIYGTGTIGAISGSLIPTFLATAIGSEKILFLTIPVYATLAFFYSRALKNSNLNVETFQKDLTPDPRPKEALLLIRRTPLLIAILGLVLFMQASVALMEYQFNIHLELNILEKDLRAAYYGKLMGFVNMLSLALQFLGGLFIVRFLGLKGSHFLVPTLLCASAFLSLAIPSFMIISCSFVFLKGLEFSLFGVIREMLYVPLPLDAKYRAKAVIDVFAYRSSKALVAIGLIALQLIAGAYFLKIASYLSVALFIAWLAALGLLFRKSSHLLSEQN